MTATQAGYSGTPLPRKLGLKPGQRRLLVDVPPALQAVLGQNTGNAPFDYIHFFVTAKAALAAALPGLKAQLAPAGMLWVSWPKKAAPKDVRVATDMTEDVIRALALPIDLVDVKVCAVDAVWSGLKLVIRVSAR